MQAAPRVLCLLVDGFEELETIAPVDLLRRAGAEVILASVAGPLHVTGRCGITLHADSALEGLDMESFAMLLLPGGPGVKALREDVRPAQLATAFASQGKSVAAICAAPTVLKDAALLTGRRFTAHFSVHAELPEVLAAERVVVDRNLITSRGAGTAIEFGLALVEHLFGAERSREIAASIMA